MVHHFITTYTDKNLVPAVIKTKHLTVSAAKRGSLAALATTEPVVMEPLFTPEDGVDTEVTSLASTNTQYTYNKDI
jgi:hypothetical protein